MNIKIDIISLFYNNEKIIKDYEKNINNLDLYNIRFNLIYNNSNDNTYEELKKLEKYNNVSVYETNSNGCSLAKNLGIKVSRKDCNYLFFLDSDFIIESYCIDELLNNINEKIKYVGYYGGNIDNKKYISGSIIENEDIIINEKEKKFIGGGCSLICKELIIKNNLYFDEYYDPFIMQDVDFTFKVLKYSNIKKLKINEGIKHIGSYTIKQFGNEFYINQLRKNSIYFMNKYNLKSETILLDFMNMIDIRIYNQMYEYYKKDIKYQNNNKEKILISKNKFYNFGNIKYYGNIDDKNILDNDKDIIIDFILYLKNYELLKNKNISIILDLKDIDSKNYNKLKDVKCIYTFSELYILFLRLIFNDKKIRKIKYKKFININNDKENKFILFDNKKYNQLINFFNEKNIKYKLVNEKNIFKYNWGNIYIDLCNNYEITKIMEKRGYWILTSNKYPNVEIVKENINGNLINSMYKKNNKLIKDIEVNINDIIEFIIKYY